MSIEEHFKKQRAEERKGRINHLLSAIANAEERICILIDEDEQDEAKEEVKELCSGIRRMLDKELEAQDA
jgi:hypothetical protein